MTTTTKLLAATAALGLLGVATATNAAPVGALTAAAETLTADAASASATEQVTYRCWRHRGHLHCGNVAPRVYSYYYAPRPYYYGSPSFSFSWGGYRRWY